MEWNTAFVARLKDFAPAAWEELPDFGLYMDQVIGLLQRQWGALHADTSRMLTPSMINNYVKSGLIRRPVKKKYGRAQLAQLSMICALKQTIPLESLKRLMNPAAEDDDGVRACYEAFLGVLKETADALSGRLQTLTPMGCAVRAASEQMLCEAMLAQAQAADA